jgi:hypothetical protein
VISVNSKENKNETRENTYVITAPFPLPETTIEFSFWPVEDVEDFFPPFPIAPLTAPAPVLLFVRRALDPTRGRIVFMLAAESLADLESTRLSRTSGENGFSASRDRALPFSMLGWIETSVNTGVFNLCVSKVFF